MCTYRVDVGARETTSGNMAATYIPPVNPAPPPRPGLLLSHRPSAFASTATTPATSTATATVTPLSAERYLSPLPSAPPAEDTEPRLPLTPPSRFKRFKIFIRSANKGITALGFVCWYLLYTMFVCVKYCYCCC